ncbi:MAG: hypothetical protein GY869_24455, partial [Planctomycetes bacterium]|nr:hypothetical protein [Planctomycetota bacterium]
MDITDSEISGSTNFIVTDSLDTSNTDSSEASPRWVFLEDYTWLGDGGANLWNVGSNWQGGVVPGSGDVARFLGPISTEDCNIDATVNVQGLTIDGEYTGTIIQNANNITVGASDWVQAGGIFTGSANNITLNDDFNMSGGTFNAGGQTMNVSGDWTSTAGAFNAGTSTIVFEGSADATVSSGTMEFNDVIFNSVNRIIVT